MNHEFLSKNGSQNSLIFLLNISILLGLLEKKLSDMTEKSRLMRSIKLQEKYSGESKITGIILRRNHEL
jgi:hypothetical protein